MRLALWAVLAGIVIYASSSSDASLQHKTSLEIHFPVSVDLPEGTSVVLEGRRIGVLTQDASSADLYRILLDEESSLIRKGAMAVVSSTWSSQRRQSVSFIEVLNPVDSTPFAEGESPVLQGYADFESFWGNKDASHWVDEQPMPLG